MQDSRLPFVSHSRLKGSGFQLTMLWALDLVNEVVDVISAVDITFLAVRVIGIFGLVPNHSLVVVEVLIAVIVCAFDLPHRGTG